MDSHCFENTPNSKTQLCCFAARLLHLQTSPAPRVLVFTAIHRGSEHNAASSPTFARSAAPVPFLPRALPTRNTLGTCP